MLDRRNKSHQNPDTCSAYVPVEEWRTAQTLAIAIAVSSNTGPRTKGSSCDVESALDAALNHLVLPLRLRVEAILRSTYRELFLTDVKKYYRDT